MNALTGLKFVTAHKNVALSPALNRRKKLAEKLQEQLACFEAQQRGDVYIAKRLQRVTDPATGVRDTIEVQRRVREWYWTNENGKLNLAVKYGATTLTLAKGGKNAIEISTAAEMLNTLKALIAATANGELDDAITEASTKTRKAFGK